ncbi:MAG: winged helix-turn-helix transcriptional regulator [Reyranella sp.]|uniref:MarR family winged helix-turn-helix transcriptional regulator n=1 Tax=Reyranella sp. TaxID=1929291 RepID=UPI001AC66BEB|nr:MarR family winged helix-turn-helix transcriptional regulator [Reyranella sp.]MBN9088236.1 winged helix-turn-helix transcriptional regulator [Reyranella sp.]
MSDRPSEAAVRAWARLERAHRAAVGTVEARLAGAGLPDLAWYDVLLELERAGTGGLRSFQLQAALLFQQYNLSRLVDRMTEAGHVAKAPSPDDGRGLVLTITRSGRALRRKMWPVYALAIEEAVGRHFTDAEARTFGDLLGRLHPSG